MDFYVKGQHGVKSPHSFAGFHGGVVWNEQIKAFADLTHVVPGGGVMDLEDIATLLAEKVEKHHPGRGADAFESARIQLLNTDFNGMWADLQKKIRNHKIWGGPVPAAVLIPDEIDPKKWNVVLTDKNGRPQAYKVRQKDIMPPPQEGYNARRGPLGWESIPDNRTVVRSRQERRADKARNRR